MSVPGVFQTKPLAETVFPLKGILVVAPLLQKKKKSNVVSGPYSEKLDRSAANQRAWFLRIPDGKKNNLA